jgi:hypothetical protein
MTAWLLAAALAPQAVFVEAESFSDPGGWSLDTQFIDRMGSPYLLAHGLGVPVKDAVTRVRFPAAGDYRLFVRTKDWVAPWKAPGAPGRFQIVVDGKVHPKEFGTEGAEWHWQEGGTVRIEGAEVSLALRDLTGFDGRCDAIAFTSDPDWRPPEDAAVLPAWRRTLLGLPEAPIEEGPFDLVVIGGGYAGICSALSAARMGLSVALVQNRGVLGGNGSSEVRVWAQGNTPPGLYPVGEIVEEITDRASASPGRADEFGDAKKEAIVRAEKKIALFLNHHGYAVEKEGASKLRAVLALDTRTSAVRRFRGTLFVDCTGHGTIGMMAGADLKMEPAGRMGMSNMWRWENTPETQLFPETPWALPLKEEDFPYPKRNHAEWFWESGFDKHPLNDLELIRDWNLRAAYGAWNAIKNGGAHARQDPEGHRNARLEWMAYVGGTRETQQLLGDVVLTEEDIVSKKKFPDGCVLSTWSIDLHYPKEQYAKAAPDNPFISKAKFGEGVDKKTGYPIPYRCFYSRNIENLFMAGRDLSVTHEALGTVRVQRTLGMVGVVVGRAASVCVKHRCTPRAVYQEHLDELIGLLKLPGRARRDSVEAPIRLEEAKDGLVVDNARAELTGSWKSSTHADGYVGTDYVHDENAGKGQKRARFAAELPKAGRYEVRLSYRAGDSRAEKVPVTVTGADGARTVTVNQKQPPPLPGGYVSLGVFRFEKQAEVVISNEGTSGHVIADAVQFVPAE